MDRATKSTSELNLRLPHSMQNDLISLFVLPIVVVVVDDP